MAEEEEVEDGEDVEAEDGEEDGDGGKKKRRLSGKVLVLAGGVFLLLVAGGGVAFWLGLFGGGEGEMEVAEVEEVKPSIFFDMPEMLVNLNLSDDERQKFLKLTVALEMTDRDVLDSIEPQLPRIMDIFQIYLRELRLEDLEGSAGVYRLKEELLRRINLVISPQRIERILFREMLVQ